MQCGRTVLEVKEHALIMHMLRVERSQTNRGFGAVRLVMFAFPQFEGWEDHPNQL